jgi:hypothetical protein
VLALAVVGAGAGWWLSSRNSSSHPSSAASGSTPGTPGQQPSGTPTTPQPSPSSPASPTPTASPGDGAVAVAPSVAQNPGTPSVVAFLQEYFSSINSHNFQEFIALRSPVEQQGLTQAQFDTGYNGTVDSGMTLEGISTAANGDTVAAVSFTSHQNPNSADNEESCTNWNISLFLETGGNGYLIDQPPPGYHASSTSCS